MVNKCVEFQGVLGWNSGSKIELFWEEGSGCISNNRSVTWLTFNQSWILDCGNSVLFPYWRKCVVKDWWWGNWGYVGA